MSANEPGEYRPYSHYNDSNVEWLGEIPAHWAVLKLRRVLQRQRCKNNDGKERKMLSLSAYRGVVVKEYDDEALVRPHEENENYQVVEPGQLVVNPMWVINSSIGMSSVSGIVSPAYRVYDVVGTFEDGYFHNLLKSSLYLTQYNRYIRGLTTYDRSVREDDFLNIETVVPPLPEQQAIGRFLDHKTCQIDTLIAAKQRLIILLQEKRAALITTSVTKGLDTSVPMKDSGVEWLGRIPSHWELIRLRYVTDKFVDYRGKTPQKTESGIPLITARNIGEGFLDFSLSQEYIREEDYSQWMVRGLPEIGDVLLTTEAPLGHAAQIDDTYVALAQRLMLIKGRGDTINHKFLMQYFLSDAGQLELYSRATGSTAIGIKASWLKTISILVPPLHEQRAIVNFIDQQEEPIRETIEKINEAIERLNEYRTALISAAVTGKVDVRDYGE